MGISLRQSINELKIAGEALSNAEASFSSGDYQVAREMSIGAIEHSAYAIASVFINVSGDPRESILSAMIYMPQKLWIEGLRVLEILRIAKDCNVPTLIDLAREAVEIATGIVMSYVRSEV